MTRLLKACLLAAACATSIRAGGTRAFHADDVRAHADGVLALRGADTLDIAARKKLLRNPVPYNAATIVPILGTTLVDMHMFGELRRSAIVGDWIAGALVPGALIALAAIPSGISSRGRRALLYSSLAIYAATRVVVCVTINHHLVTYNRHIRLRLGL